MKKIHLFHYFVFFVFFAFAACQSCKKDDTPPVPNEKHNYFACKVDGKHWETCGPINMSWITAQYFSGSYFDIEAHNSCEIENSIIYLKIFGLNDTGTFVLGGLSNNFGYYSIGTASLQREYYTDTTHTGVVHVSKFEMSGQKISGTYNFNAFYIDSNKTISITDGNFENVQFYKY